MPQNLRSLRNLRQYQDMTDEEYDELMAKKALDLEPVKEFEDRIERKLKSFGNDYDLSDMKFNDTESLRALAQALITLDDLETYTYKLRQEGINEMNLTLLDKVSRQMSVIRQDISRLQDDLKISRKIRKGDKDESVLNYIESLKEKAKKFYESRMSYVFCECGMLLGTVWTHYPNSDNKLIFKCNRILDNGHICGKITKVTTQELLNNRGSNHPEFLPESML